MAPARCGANALIRRWATLNSWTQDSDFGTYSAIVFERDIDADTIDITTKRRREDRKQGLHAGASCTPGMPTTSTSGPSASASRRTPRAIEMGALADGQADRWMDGWTDVFSRRHTDGDGDRPSNHAQASCPVPRFRRDVPPLPCRLQTSSAAMRCFFTGSRACAKSPTFTC